MEHTPPLLFFSLLLIVQSVSATPPTRICDEKITDKEFYKNAMLSNNIIKQINNKFEIYEIYVDDCFVGGQLRITAVYKLPAELSANNISYSYELLLSYSRDSPLRWGLFGEKGLLTYEAVLNETKNMIEDVETNPRVMEFISKLGPLVGSLAHNTELRTENGRIEYSFSSGQVRGYLLPNALEWKQFPEIEMAHKIIEKQLLRDELADCIIGKGEKVEEGHSYTLAQFHDSDNEPWYLRVALVCQDRVEEAVVNVNPDGSYELLGIDTTMKEFQKLQEASRRYGQIIWLLALGISCIVIFLILRRKKLDISASNT